MKIKKCPYCGKRISYYSAFSGKSKGEFVCSRCGKESKVIVDRKIFLFFAVAAILSVAIGAGWIFAGMLSNALGILLVAVPLIIFYLFVPKFIYFEPLKKYKKSMEAKKAGIEYSDNLLTTELKESEKPTFLQNDNTGNFQINSDVFNKIREDRNAAREQLRENTNTIRQNLGENSSYVPIINDVSEDHISTQAPLKKIHSETKEKINRTHHYIPIESDSHENEKKKSDGNRYSANRRF